MDTDEVAAMLGWLAEVDPRLDLGGDAAVAEARVRAWSTLLAPVDAGDVVTWVKGQYASGPPAEPVGPVAIRSAWQADRGRAVAAQRVASPRRGATNPTPSWFRQAINDAALAAEEFRVSGIAEPGSPAWRQGMNAALLAAVPDPVGDESPADLRERWCGNPACRCDHTSCRRGWDDNPEVLDVPVRCSLCAIYAPK